MALETVLDRKQKELLEAERELLNRLVSALIHVEILPEDLDQLQRSINQLHELFLLVIVGEFNSGKSAFINALLGQALLEQGVTPTTHQIHLLRYGDAAQQDHREPDLVVMSLPVPILKEINIVDTPGTNAVIRQHEQITQKFIPRSDLVLFVTSADRPFTESERAFLERIQQWGKKVMIVINKIDIMENEEAVRKVGDYIRENSYRLLGVSPEVFPMSAKLALRAKTGSDKARAAQDWTASGFEPLERYILETLDERGRIRLKLLNPLGVAEQTLKRYQASVAERLELLAEDFKTIQTIDSQLKFYRQDMMHDFGFRLSDIENYLLSMETRGLNFFDETLRLGRLFDLINSERIRGAFEREVVADTPRQVEAATAETIDWFVDHDLRQWQSTMDYLNRRRLPDGGKKIIGELGSPFEYNRRALLDSVGRASQEAIGSYDKSAEARAIGEATQMAVAQAALLEVGAVGLGTVVMLALTSAAADVTGLLAASVLATLGFFVIPSKRKRAKADFQAKISSVRQKLVTGLTSQLERELDRSIQRIHEAIEPYTRFVRAEGDRLKLIQKDLGELEKAIELLKVRIERL
jgi:small GTP-binding protein